ncbi:GNAT family N-acetyltransferase [Devriesea agamarum]|uniref:GNAT family N-acetyltransferase n=1 Tax=Devriesea agamarum TaxID=472569 RepID=UPI00071CF436|nr:GNAT family N-acetyltransferase [Devriesea agamarum]
MAQIRPAVAEDIPDIRALEVAAGQRFRQVGLERVADDDPPEVEVLACLIAHGQLWVAQSCNGFRIDGWACGEDIDGHGHVEQVSVHPDAAGKGLGRRLVSAVESWARAQGSHWITLTTYRDIPWNGPWYERLGYRLFPEAQWGPHLKAVREQEIAHGLDLAPRIAMIKDL